MTHQPIQMTVAADCPLLSDSEVTKRILRVTLAAEDAPRRADRLPVNLALVLDRSGSMSGDKLRYALQAAAHVLTLLSDNDQAAVVTFDDTVELVSRSLPMTVSNRRTLQQALYRVLTGGSTALFAGWMEGAKQAAESYLESGVNRVLLFTDGQANCGESEPVALARHAAGLRERGLSTSTFGVGLDYNHHLLEGIADKGGGQYHFIETPHQIPDIFARELDEILTIQARRVEVRLHAPTAVSMKLIGSLHHENLPGCLTIPLGDLCAGRSIEYYIELLTPVQPPGSDLLFEITAHWQTESSETQSQAQTFRFRYDTHAQAKAAPRDHIVRKEATMVRIAEIEANALRMESEGSAEEAAQMLLDAVAKYAPYLEPSRVSDLRELAERLKNQMVFDFEHKSRHHNAFMRRERRSKM